MREERERLLRDIAALRQKQTRADEELRLLMRQMALQRQNAIKAAQKIVNAVSS